jgi:hypothetical protein
MLCRDEPFRVFFVNLMCVVRFSWVFCIILWSGENAFVSFDNDVHVVSLSRHFFKKENIKSPNMFARFFGFKVRVHAGCYPSFWLCVSMPTFLCILSGTTIHIMYSKLKYRLHRFLANGTKDVNNSLDIEILMCPQFSESMWLLCRLDNNVNLSRCGHNFKDLLSVSRYEQVLFLTWHASERGKNIISRATPSWFEKRKIEKTRSIKKHNWVLVSVSCNNLATN